MDKRFAEPIRPEPWMRNVPEKRPAEKTLLVLGQGRGGTSVVAAVADALGVYMGPPNELRNAGSFEAFDFIHGTPARRAETVAKNNASHNIWGWKFPYSDALLRQIPEGTRNPHLLFVLRDVVAITQSYAKHTGEVLEAAAEFIYTHNTRLFVAALNTDLPSLLVSFERIKTYPEGFVDSLATFLELCPTVEQRTDAIQRISFRGGYLIMPKEYGWPPAPLPHTTPEKWKD
jgi:hypothetical protein